MSASYIHLRKVQFFFLILITIYFNCTITVSAQCTTIDQSQLNYNGGMSARNLPGYSEWQSFTAGSTGILCQIDMGFFNFMSGTGTFNIYSGPGTSGSLLQTQPVTVSGTGNFFHTFLTSVPVTSGAIYTFHFIPIQGGGLPDPYGVQVENPGTYTGGELNIVDPSGTYPTGFDMVFKTYVSTSTGIESLTNSPFSVTVSPNPFSTITTLKLSEPLHQGQLIIINSLGKEVKTIDNLNGSEIVLERNGLTPGIYFVKLAESSNFLKSLKVIISP